jgi:3-deoxy-D-manno-octulosonic-acid transferase
MARLYSVLVYATLPIALLRLLWKSRHNSAYRKRWRERLGFYARDMRTAGYWIHAVSVGEVQAATPLIRHLLDRHPQDGVMVTTTTPTGSRRLRDLFEDRVSHVYTPVDLTPVVNRFLDAVHPRLVVVMETEIWPNMLRACQARGVPVILANARLSQRSARGYARIGPFTRETFGRLRAIAAQSPQDAERFRALGVSPERIHIIGSLKFDLRLPGSLLDQSEVMRRAWGTQRPVWVAASTHEGEEEQVLSAHRMILHRLPAALLVLVPRHPERFDRVAALVGRHGLGLARRSAGRVCTSETQVFLGDTMGELPVFLAAADAAFIGGSLVPVGGHNLLEAAAVGVPAAIGPHVFNFAQITELLVSEGGAVQVENADALARCMADWLSDAAARTRAGENGRRVVEQNRGVLKRLTELIEAEA